VNKTPEPLWSGSGVFVFGVKSDSGSGVYTVTICDQSGDVWCDCDDFWFRKQLLEPSILTPNKWCKHIRKVVCNRAA